MILLVNDIINAFFYVEPFIFRLNFVFIRYHLTREAGNYLIYYIIFVGRFFGGAGYYQRGPGLVHEDGIDLVRYRVIEGPLRHLFFSYNHVVAKIIKSELVVGPVSDIARVCRLSRDGVHIVLYDSDS